MTRKRLSVWILAGGAATCFLLLVLALILLILLSYHTVPFNGTGVAGVVEYPPELLDGNEDRLGALTVVGLPLTPAWEYQAPGPIDRPPLYQRDHLILKGDKVLISLNASSGSEEWRHHSPFRIYMPYSENLVLSDGVIAYQTYPWPSQLQVINLETGQGQWETSSAVRGFTADNDSRLFTTVQDAYQALESTNGRIVWISGIQPIERGSSPMLYDPSAGEVYVWEDTRVLVVLDVDTGKIRRRLDHTLPEGNPLIIHSGILYIRQSRSGSLLAFNGQEDKPLWTVNYSLPDDMFQPLIHMNILYSRTTQETLLAIDCNTGVIEWQYPLASDSSASGKLLSNPVILDNVIYGIFSDAVLRGFNADTGQQIGHIQFSDVSDVPFGLTVPGLAASENMLFVSLGKTKLFAFKTNP